MIESELKIEDILEFAKHPRYYGQKYLVADSKEKLLLVLGEACCIAAFSLVKILKLPKRGSLVLDLMKVICPHRYRNWFFLHDFSFSHCLIFITRKLRDELSPKLGQEIADDISLKAYAYGGSFLGSCHKIF